jgi:hypothetical protein
VLPFRPGANPSALDWGIPIPALHGQNIFPSLSSVFALLAAERPGQCWGQLEEFLLEAGVNSSEHILLAEPTVLAFVGNMGTRQATVLRNYAKRVVLPVLGLHGTYQEDEIDDEDCANAPPTCKRSLDLGDSVVRSLYKKPKTEHVDDTPATPIQAADQDLLNDEFNDEEVDGYDSDSEEYEPNSDDDEGEDDV